VTFTRSHTGRLADLLFTNFIFSLISTTKGVDLIAERIQILGGVSVAVAHDVSEMTRLERPLRDRGDTRANLETC
jgi:DNA-binding ferritin-like protein